MNNVRVEQLIAKKKGLTELLIRFIAVSAAIILMYLGFRFAGIWGLALGFFVIYLVYYVAKMTDVEYEYTLVNDELTIDCIFGRDKRKTVAVYNITQAEIFAPINSDRVQNYMKNTMIEAKRFTSGRKEQEEYLLLINTGTNRCKVIIEPNEKLFDGIKTYIPSKTYKDSTDKQ